MAHRPFHLMVYRGKIALEEQSNDFMLLWNLNEPVQVCSDNETFEMKKDDLFSLNPYENCTVQAKNGLLVAFLLDDAQLRDCFGGKNYRIRCSSAHVVSDNYAPLRRLLGQMLRILAEGGAYQEVELGRLYYELALLLMQHFTVEMPSGTGTRAEQFTRYIEEHYNEELSLQQISEAFHMAPQYFSRQFRKQTGQAFYHSLIVVRLRHAKQDMLESDAPLLRLALSNGFANLESFYRYFQEDTGKAPQEWREEKRQTNDLRQIPEIQELVSSVLQEEPAASPAQKQNIRIVDVTKKECYDPFWKEVLPLGEAHLLDRSLIVSQLRILQHEIGFRFVRIRADCRDFTAGEEYFFYKEEQHLDELVDQGLMIWLYVEFRQLTVPEQMYAYLDRLFSHFANRYSIQNIRKWRLELTYNTILTPEKAKPYWACRQRLQAILNKYGCREPLLCAGLALGAPEAVESFCRELVRRGEVQSAQTFEAEPYLYYETEQGPVLSRATDSSYLKNQLLTLQQNQPCFREMVRDVYITSWNDNMLNTSGMNDSCYKGANLLKNMIDCFGRVRSMAHNIPLDAVYPEKMKKNVLFGGNGLLTQHGIPKPSYYAYSFLCRVGEYHLAHDDHAILFAGKEGNYQIVCHNCKGLNYRYYLDEQNSVLGAPGQYFEETEPLTLEYRLTGVRNGRYILKQRLVSPENGSVQDLLRQMGAAEGIYVHSHDLEYLRQVSVPQIHLQETQAVNGELSIHLTIPANAILYLHIIYQY